MKRNLVAAIALVLVSVCVFASIGLASCGQEPAPEHRPEPSRAAVQAVGAGPAVRINGYVIDVKGAPPAVPPGLDTVDPAPTTGVAKVTLPDVLVPGQGGVLPPRGQGADPRARALRWIVQLDGPVRSADVRRLAELGEVGDYLPDFAFFVTADRAGAERIAGLPFVRGVVRVKPAYKLARPLADAMVERSSRSLRIRVRVDRPEDLAEILSEVHASRGSVRAVGRDLATVQVPSAALARLARIERVVWIEEAPELRLLNDVSSWTIQTYVPGDWRIWSHGLRGAGQIVGVGDTGIDHDMCFFADPGGAPIGASHRKLVGYASFADAYDGNMGHGTHVSGTVAGNQAPITGASTASGMAPEARLFMTDLTPGEEDYVYPPADLGDLFLQPYLNGARLHTNSWGASSNAYDGYAWSVDRFMWEHRDFLALFANGNAGPGPGSVGTPATAKSIISVGASENGASAENAAGFSSHGPAFDGRTKPTVMAPGVAIVSADSDGLPGTFNCGTIALSGTSMATPTVAGAAALVRQYYVDGYWPHGSASAEHGFSPSAALVKATLVNGAQVMGGEYAEAPIPSMAQGWGRINLSNTLRFAGEPTVLDVADVTSGLETGAAWSRSFLSSGARPLEVTLVWTDYPASSAAATSLVNDLDLVVTSPDGAIYLGNQLTNGTSIPGGAPDRLNVEEQVIAGGGARGRYVVSVVGHNVPYGPQPFAVVVTGGAAVTSAGLIDLDKGNYGGADTIRVEVGDVDLNVDPAVSDHLAVSIRSSNDEELLTLTESGPDTGVFVGALPTSSIGPPASDGSLLVADGDLIAATYLDANDGTGAPATVTATARADLAPPVIASVETSALGQASAVVSFTTGEPTTAAVEYGTSPAIGATVSDHGLATVHAIRIDGLQEGTTYHYAVRATDEAGNVTWDDASGGLYAFTTPTLPPELTVGSSRSTETYHPDAVIFGTARDPSGVQSVTVNGLPAIYRASDGYYELAVSLSLGANVFTAVATDGLGNAATAQISVTRLPQPDLRIQSISGPTVGGAGASTRIEQTICNAGEGASPGSGVIAYYLSADEIVSPANDFLFREGAVYGEPIPAGECVTFTVDVAAPIDPVILGQTYFLGAYVDILGDVWESDESNNTQLGGRITIDRPDLTVTAVTCPPSVATETTFAVPATFSNVGLSMSGSFCIAVYLSPDATFSPDDVLLSSGRINSLRGGESFAATFSALIPSTVPPGSYRVLAVADPGREVAESNEGNNSLARELVGVLAPDLVVSAVAGPSSASSGAAIDVSTTVAAQASLGGASGFSVGIYLSPDATITLSDLRIGSFSVNGLAPGQVRTSTTRVTVPTTVVPGTYRLGALADFMAAVVESDEGNNALAGNEIVIAGPDLIMSSVSGPASAPPGGTITVWTTVAASASGSAAPPFHVGIFLSSVPTITRSDVLVASRRVAGLAPGAVSTEATTFPLPALAPGTWYLGAIADNFALYLCDPVMDWCTWVSDLALETDETNNVALGGTLFIGSRPDLAVTAVSAPATAGPGEGIVVSSTVTNVGNLEAGSFEVGIYLSTDAVIDTTDALLGSRGVAGLAAGGASSEGTPVTLPAGLPAGTYYLGAVADRGGVVAEVSEANNALAAPNATVVGGPDLAVTAVSAPATAGPGEGIVVSSTVTNVGNLAAGSFEVGIYLSSDAAIGTGDVLLGSRGVAGLAAGGSSSEGTPVTLPADLPAGTYYLGAVADRGGLIAEVSEANNALAASPTVVGRPDLAVTAVSAPATAGPGEGIAVSSTVTNVGNLAVGSFEVGIYLSTDAAIGTGDVLLGSRGVAGLAAGGSSSEATPVALPADLPAGTYYLGAVADRGGVIAEASEANNALAASPTVISPKALADLVMAAVSSAGSGAAGGQLNTSSTVRNVGSLAAGRFEVRIYLSTDAVITTSDTLIGTRTVAGLAPGGSSTGRTSAAIPRTLAPGTYFVGAIADPGAAIVELAEDNNVLSGNTVVVKKPK